MTKQSTINKDKVIFEIFMVVAEQWPLEDLKEKAEKVCREYFPNCDKIMINTVRDFAHHAQHYYWYLNVLRSEVNRYDKENREKRLKPLAARRFPAPQDSAGVSDTASAV